MIIIKMQVLLKHLKLNKKTFYEKMKYDMMTIFHVFLLMLK